VNYGPNTENYITTNILNSKPRPGAPLILATRPLTAISCQP